MSPTPKSNISSKISPLESGSVHSNASNGSTSTSMSKRTNKAYSNEDLMKAILEIQNSQSVQLQELHGCLNSLKNEISELKNENMALRHENRLRFLLVWLSWNQNRPSLRILKCRQSYFAKFLREIFPNIIALSPIKIDLPTDLKLVRHGNNKARKPRPIKIICKSRGNAAQLIAEFRQAVRSGSSIRDGLRIIRDKTSLERKLLRTSHIELENRNKSGESNLVISYVKGVPTVQRGVYIPPSALIEIYTSHAETVDEMWQSSGCNMGIICDDFNLPNVDWHNNVSELSLSGSVNDNVKVIGDVYRFLDFSQNNSIRNQVGSLLDLVFTSELDIDVDTTPDSLVMPDKYHPPLSITYSMPMCHFNRMINTHSVTLIMPILT
ncbi:hypothetical protein QTP88_006580 [Uroleucon formosanum]